MKIIIPGKTAKEVNLTNRDYITEGGEGKIYGKGGYIYKIYADQSKLIPIDKIKELAGLKKDNIIAPLSPILSSKKVPIGIVMKWVKETEPICKLFTTDYKKRNNITDACVVELVENIVETISFIHSKKCLIVDGNEMNYLVSTKKYSVPYFIDVDSYQTPHFNATAISPAIMDCHTKGFTELTDWYSLAVIAVQLFVGIHPYKGKHPKYKKYDLEQRMKDNVSIFNSDVRLPKAVRDFSYIPKNYMDWFIKLFEKGQRLMPPSIAGNLTIVVKDIPVKGTDMFVITECGNFGDDIIHYRDNVVFTKDNKAHNGMAVVSCDIGADALKCKTTLSYFLVSIKKDRLCINEPNGVAIECNIATKKFTFINGMLFIHFDEHICEVEVEKIGTTYVAVVRSTWNVLPNASKMYDGIVCQNALGNPFFVIPYKMSTGKTACCVMPVNELKEHKIIDMKHDNGVVIVVGYAKGKYVKFTFKFNEDYTKYECGKEEDVAYHIPNFVTLSNGVVISITPEDVVEIFSNRLGKSDVKRVQDDAVYFGMKLCKEGTDVLFRESNKLFKIKMK